MKLNGVMLGTEDTKRLGEFYTKIFGEPMWHEGEWYGYMIGTGSLMIGPHSEVKGKNSTPGRILIVLQSDDVRGEFEKIKTTGAEIVAEPYQPDKDKSADTWLATFADPDGNYLQLMTPWKD